MSFVTKNHFLAVIAALLCIPLIFSFSSSDSKQNEELFSDCLFSISYDQTKESYLRLPDDGSIANLNAREIVKHKRKMEKKHIEKCLDSRKNFKITIQHLNHQEVLESWMPQVATTVIDFTGIKLLDPNGNILKERPLSKDEMTAHQESSRNLFLNTERLKVLNETEKQELRSSGLTVEEKGQDKLKIYNNL